MADATARIEPHVLSAALRDLEGVDLDPSTEEGALASARIVERLMAEPESAARLTDALDRHADAALSAEAPFPQAYGPAIAADATLASDASLNVPPIGSPEFEAFMAVPAPGVQPSPEERAIDAMPVANPSELGFAAEAAEPPPRAEVDAALRYAQRLFEVKLRAPHTFRDRFRAALDVLLDRGEHDWDVLAMPTARNRFVVQLMRENTRWRWESIAAGDFLYVLVIADGKLALKDRLPLSDLPAARQRLEAAFDAEPMAGVRTMRALRIAMSGGMKVPASTLEAAPRTAG